MTLQKRDMLNFTVTLIKQVVKPYTHIYKLSALYHYHNLTYFVYPRIEITMGRFYGDILYNVFIKKSY